VQIGDQLRRFEILRTVRIHQTTPRSALFASQRVGLVHSGGTGLVAPAEFCHRVTFR
jgi:hypothetical protein